MTVTLNWKTIGGLIISGVSGWLIRHLLDHFNLFERLTLAAHSSDASNLYKSLFITRYSLFDLLLMLLLAIGSYLIGTWFVRNLFSASTQHAKAVKEINKFNTTSWSEKHLQFKWEVVFNDWDKPEIANLRPFCTKHGLAIPMNYDKILEKYVCQGCNNCVTNYARYKALLQGELEQRWERLVPNK